MYIKDKVYASKLANSFDKMAHLVTEDLIRQWFIEIQELSLCNTIIEKPYRELLSQNSQYYSEINSRARADLHYDGYNEQIGEKEDVVIEFKYHKKVDRSTTCKTTNMGEVFRDLNRLSTLKDKERYFIYVFDQEMLDYYGSQPFKFLKNIGCKSAIIPSITNNYIKDEHGEFYKNAFSSFSDNYQDFSSFNYTIDVTYSEQITTYKKFDGAIDNIYMIILKVH